MKHSLLLFLSAYRLHAQVMVGGKIAMQLDFTDSPEGRESFAAFLQATKHPTYLLTDLIEEDFRHETVPHLFGSSRAALLKRKFDQFYRGTPFHQATLLQRQKTGRRDDDMLFSALTNPALINPWLNIMLEQQTPLAGIYSVPQISAPLVEDHPSNHLLLISFEKNAGLRQTYFSNRRLQISRLTPVHEDLTFHDAVVNELARTYQYLKSLSLLPQGQTLDVRILCHSNDRVKLEANKPPRGADMRYEFADISEIARQLKIPFQLTDSDASQIFLHQLAARPPKTHYANSTHTHFYSLWWLKRAMNLSSGLLLLGATIWSAISILQSSSNAADAELQKSQAQQILNQSHQITLSFPNTYAPAADMKAGVIIMHKLRHYARTPQDVMAPVSAALDRHPKIMLQDISWEMNANEPVVDNTLAEAPAEVIIIKGRLDGFASDYRAALDYLENFQLDLSARGYQVTALSKPLDVSPTGSIADRRDTGENELAFSVKISRRPSI